MSAKVFQRTLPSHADFYCGDMESLCSCTILTMCSAIGSYPSFEMSHTEIYTAQTTHVRFLLHSWLMHLAAELVEPLTGAQKAARMAHCSP